MFDARCERLRAPTMTAATPGRPSIAALATVAMSARWRSAIRRSVASSAWNRLQPPKSSMISLYLVSERFSSGSGRFGHAEPPVAQEPARDCAVAYQRDAPRGGGLHHRLRRAAVEQ